MCAFVCAVYFLPSLSSIVCFAFSIGNYRGRSVLKRCVSALPPAICPLVLRNHLQLNAKRMSRDLSTPIRFPDQILSLGQGAAREESRDCSDMGSQILRKKASDLDTMFSRIVGNVVQLISNQTSTQAVSLSWVKKRLTEK